MTDKRLLKVFLSYASQDKLLVRELSRRLVGEGWIDTWQDEKNLLPGQDWRVKIEEAVEDADVVIICLSNHSVSKEGHVQKELRYAREIALEKPEDAIFLIPLRLDECEVPRGLRFYQWVDYFDENKDSSYKALVASLKLRYEQKIKSEEAERFRKELQEREREAAEKIAREKAEKDAVENARLEVEELGRQKVAKEKTEREAAERAERQRREKEEREKQAREAREKEKRESEKKVEKPGVIKPKGGSQITYWFGGFVVIVLGIMLLSMMNNGQNSIEPPSASQQTQTLSLSTPTFENKTSVSPLDITLTLPATPASEDVNGFLLYRANGINGLPEYFFADLSSGERYQLTKNDGFSISSEKISNNKKYLAFLFRYGNDDRSKLGVIDLSTEIGVQINNQLALVNADRYDWLTDNTLIFTDNESSQVGIYNLVDDKITILGSGYYFSASPDGNKVVTWSWKNKNMAVFDIDGTLLCEFAFDSSVSNVVWSPTSEKFVVANGSNIKLINCEVDEDVLLATGENAKIFWSPDGQKVVISFVNDGVEALRTWLKDGQLDKSILLDNKDSISFAWGSNSEDYAYVFGVRQDDAYKNILHVNGSEYEVEGSDYAFDLIRLPDGNFIFGAYGSGSYVFDVDKKEINQISDSGYYLIDESNDRLVILELYSSTQDSTFIVIDENGIRNLEITERWTWEWLLVGNDLLLVSEQDLIFSNSNKHYPINPSLPVGATAVVWLPVNLNPNISLLPTASPPLDLGIFTCNATRVESGQYILARRTCSCGESMCNCVDYYYGGGTTEWTRERGGIEDYFLKLGGSCTNP